MIKPTIGRVVLFHPAGIAPDTLSEELLVTHAAIVTHVWSDDLVNLAVFDSNGVSYSRTSVALYQGEGDMPASAFAEWMPYQIGQAKAAAETAS